MTAQQDRRGDSYEKARYSLLLSGNYAAALTRRRAEALIHAGTKLFLFVAPSKAAEFSTFSDAYGREFFNLYSSTEPLPNLQVVDGRFDSLDRIKFNYLADNCMSFNLEQYLIEHEALADVVIVRASAGTGKTTVMIDRIVFLFATDDSLSPEDIAMITFTNKATASMLGKLQERLRKLWRMTGNIRWFELMEQLGRIRLSTIDSFFLDLIGNEGGSLGYGRHARLTGFRQEKREILLQILNERFVANPVDDLLKENVLSLHDLSDTLLTIWDKLRSRGFFYEDIRDADFGLGYDLKSRRVGHIIAHVLSEAERRYSELKKQRNAFALDDIRAELDAIVRKNPSRLRIKPFKHLFIDEFQDTDTSQIKIAAWLRRRTGCCLFVVGDVKQSIYRFRGAEESAFEELEAHLRTDGIVDGDGLRRFVLHKNYRTSRNVVNRLNDVFQRWSRKEDRLLAWDGAAQGGRDELGVCRFKSERRRSHCWDDSLEFAADDIQLLRREVGGMCVLVRTNYEVEGLLNKCRERRIPCIARVSGGFYRTRPVRDLHDFLAALLFPGDSRCLWNAFETPYVSACPSPEEVLLLEGDESAIVELLRKKLDSEGWDELRRSARYDTLFPWLERTLVRINPIGRYSALLRRGDRTKVETKLLEETYRLNLNKLLGILYEHFSGDFASLDSLYRFLDVKIQTGDDEDALYPDPTDLGAEAAVVEIMTVHKAKGLEFNSVFVPFTWQSFFYEKQDEDDKSVIDVLSGLDEGGRLCVGWKRDNLQNSLYGAGFEAERLAVRRDEARLLYVALTRAKRNLVVTMPRDVKPDTWAELLSEEVHSAS